MLFRSFIRVPGLEEPLKLPIPFEIGYIFKALPEALVNFIKTGDSDDAKAALEMITRQVIPGGSSMPTIDVGGKDAAAAAAAAAARPPPARACPSMWATCVR